MDERWDSDVPYDETAIEWLIDGEYLAFIRYNTDRLQEGSPANTIGNVITLHPDARPAPDTDMDVVESFKEHEAQHVIQHYQIEDADAEYEKHPLKYEKEACARQIIKGTVKTEDIYRSLVDHLMKHGMTKRQAVKWIGCVSSRLVVVVHAAILSSTCCVACAGMP